MLDQSKKYIGKEGVYKHYEAQRKINQAYNEYMIASSLKHDNIQDYKFFIHQYKIEFDLYKSITVQEQGG